MRIFKTIAITDYNITENQNNEELRDILTSIIICKIDDIVKEYNYTEYKFVKEDTLKYLSYIFPDNWETNSIKSILGGSKGINEIIDSYGRELQRLK